MFNPVSYISPCIDKDGLSAILDKYVKRNNNFMSPATIEFPILPFIHGLAHKLGLNPPLWRYTRPLRSVLRFVGA